MRVELTAEALEDLEQIFFHILADHPDKPEIAIRMRRKLESEIGSLETFSAHRPGRVPGTRELIVKPYVIPYLHASKEKLVLVLRVLHGRQRYP